MYFFLPGSWSGGGSSTGFGGWIVVSPEIEKTKIYRKQILKKIILQILKVIKNQNQTGTACFCQSQGLY